MASKIFFRVISVCAVLAWMTLIFMFSAQKGSESSDISTSVSYRLVSQINDIARLDMESESISRVAAGIEFPVRKMAHMCEYGILCLFTYLSLLSFDKPPKIRNIAAIIFVIIYAASDEIHQYFVEGRSSRPVDVLIDTAGACIMLLLISLVRKIIRSKFEKR